MRKGTTLPPSPFFSLRSAYIPTVRYFTSICLFISFLGLPINLRSQQVFLDYSYGVLGFAEYSAAPIGVGPNEVKVKVQSDGKIIQSGTVFGSGSWQDFYVLRLNQDGSIDSTFGTSGRIILSVGTGHDILKDIAIQEDDKILLAGHSHDVGIEKAFTVVRLQPDGALDNSFGTAGIVRTYVINTVNVDNLLNAISIQDDGKILAGGLIQSVGGDMALVRYNTDGSLDLSFGVNGKVITHINSTDPNYNNLSYIVDILVQPDNKIITVGRASFDSVEVIAPGSTISYDLTNYVLARYNTEGTLDNSFGTGGIVLTPMSSFDLFAAGNAYTGALTSDNKIIVQGEIYNHEIQNNQLGLIKYNADGSINNSYGIDGLATASFGTTQNFHDLLLQNDGKSLVIGMTRFDENWGFTILRFNDDGTSDLSFNNGYLYFSSPATGRSYAWSGAFQNDKLIVAGNSLRNISSSLTHNFLSIRIRLTPVECGEIIPPLSVNIPDTVSYSIGVDLNTVYPGFSPAASITLRANASGGISPYSYLWSTGATTESITVSPVQQTTYTVVIIDAAGCQATAAQTVTVLNVDCGNGKAKICHATNDPNHPIDICVSESAVESHLAQGCSLGECISSIASQNTVQGSEQQHAFSLKVYPNPSRNVFGIIALTENLNEKIEMRLIDVSGRTVEMHKNINPNQPFSVGQNLKAGIYIVEMRQGSRSEMKKLLKL